jgi:hypothetical protein
MREQDEDLVIEEMDDVEPAPEDYQNPIRRQYAPSEGELALRAHRRKADH